MNSTQSNRAYLKPAIDYGEQLNLLVKRGLIIKDRAFAFSILKQLSYYRLSAYSLSLRSNNRFLPNTSIEKIYRIYLFDASLRHLLFALIEPVEILLRAQFSNTLALSYGNTAHLDPKHFVDQAVFC